MLDLLLITTLGFHKEVLVTVLECVELLSPSPYQQDVPSWQQQLCFHALLNLGRVASPMTALVGAGIGAGLCFNCRRPVAGVGKCFAPLHGSLTGNTDLVWTDQVSPGILPRIQLLPAPG